MEQIKAINCKRKQLLSENSVIQVHQVTLEELGDFISQTIKNQFDNLNSNFQAKEPNQYLTRNQVKELLNVDLSTLYNWNRRKILKPYGVGGRVYYKRSEIEAVIVELKVKK